MPKNHMPKNNLVTRRRFLEMTGAGLIGLTGLGLAGCQQSGNNENQAADATSTQNAPDT